MNVELLQWITWMRTRRNRETVDFVRQGRHLDKAAALFIRKGRAKASLPLGQVILRLLSGNICFGACLVHAVPKLVKGLSKI